MQIKSVTFLGFVFTFCSLADHSKADGSVDYESEELSSDSSSLTNDTLNQRGCRIPNLDLFSPDVMKVYSEEPGLFCNGPVTNVSESNVTRSPLFTEDTRFLYFNNSALSSYGCDEVFCFYSSFERVEGAEDNVRYFNSKILQTDAPNEITDEFVEVICKSMKTDEVVYKDYFAFLPPKVETEKRCNDAADRNEPSLNILLIGLDTLSRLQFHRHFPRSATFLKERMDAVEMMGYNKVAENTYPNLVPLLSGLSAKQLNVACLRDNNKLVDACPIIWKEYHKKGFRTIFVEDAPDLAIFNFGANGFQYQPTDYYVRPMYLEYERKVGYDNIGCGYRCLGSRSSLAFLLNHAEKTARVFRDKKYFGFHWSCSATHDTFNIPAQVDETLEKFLVTLNNGDNLLNNTLLIVMADHGPRLQRIDDFYYTPQGQCEKRLPLLMLVLPDWFKKKYAAATRNLIRNSRMLTSHYDLHRTLHDLMNLNLLEEDTLLKRYGSDEKSGPGRSLFLPISTNRTCSRAGIPPEYCACDCTSLPLPTRATTLEASSSTTPISTMDPTIGLSANYSAEGLLNASSPQLS